MIAAAADARSVAAQVVARILDDGVTLDAALQSALAAAPRELVPPVRSLSFGAVRGFYRHEAILHRVLNDCAVRIAAGEPIAAVLRDGHAAITRAGLAVDYLEARNAETLVPMATAKAEPIRLLVAVRIGKTRLIDNRAV